MVLSGCATGDGRELRGEGVLGLTYGFLANGSHTVVASLWPVEDALTARFMEEFYAAYRSSGSAPQSTAHRAAAHARNVGPGGLVELRGARQRPAVAARRCQLTTDGGTASGTAARIQAQLQAKRATHLY